MGVAMSIFGLLDFGAAICRLVGVKADPRYSYLTNLWGAAEYGLAGVILLAFADRIVRLVYRR
jgi:hypothetical protein